MGLLLNHYKSNKDDLDKVIDYKTRFSNYISSKFQNDISKISWCFKLLFAKKEKEFKELISTLNLNE